MTNEQNAQPESDTTFTVDGQTFTVTSANQTAESILRLAGINPSEFDLGEVKHNGDTKVFTDAQTVHVKAGDAFLSVRKSAPVA